MTCDPDVTCFRWRAPGERGWTARVTNNHQALTVDLGDTFRVTRLATQGYPRSQQHFVRSFIVQYSLDGRAFRSYRTELGQAEVSGQITTSRRRGHALRFG